MTSLRSLARELGVSPATVSRALAGLPHVQDRTRARILAAAAAAGLASPSAGASAGRRLLALVEHGAAARWSAMADILAGAAQGARQSGAVLHSLAVDGQPAALTDIAAAARLRPSALLLCFWHDDASACALSHERPCVVVGQPPAETHAARYASFDAAHGTLQLLDHLLELGHRRIAFLGARTTGWRGHERRGAAMAAAGMRGVTLRQLTIEDDASWNAVRTAMRQGISGWICDAQGTGEALLMRCRSWSLRVPADASICGFFFHPPAPGQPRLTGMRGDWQAVGRIAARWALTRPDRLDPSTRLLVGSRVEPGDTTAPPRTST